MPGSNIPALEFAVNQNLGILSKQTKVIYDYKTLQSFTKSTMIPLVENVKGIRRTEYSTSSDVYLDIVFSKNLNVMLLKPIYFISQQPTTSLQTYNNNITFTSRFVTSIFIQGPGQTILRFGEETEGIIAIGEGHYEQFDEHYCHLYLQFQPEFIVDISNHI
jgi:hypothetical protein